MTVATCAYCGCIWVEDIFKYGACTRCGAPWDQEERGTPPGYDGYGADPPSPYNLYPPSPYFDDQWNTQIRRSW